MISAHVQQMKGAVPRRMPNEPVVQLGIVLSTIQGLSALHSDVLKIRAFAQEIRGWSVSVLYA